MTDRRLIELTDVESEALTLALLTPGQRAGVTVEQRDRVIATVERILAARLRHDDGEADRG